MHYIHYIVGILEGTVVYSAYVLNKMESKEIKVNIDSI